MTDGHTHRLVKVKQHGLVARVLGRPLIHSTNMRRVDRSPYPYGPCRDHDRCWYLSTLSILHRWTGLTLWFEEAYDDEHPD